MKTDSITHYRLADKIEDISGCIDLIVYNWPTCFFNLSYFLLLVNMMDAPPLDHCPDTVKRSSNRSVISITDNNPFIIVFNFTTDRRKSNQLISTETIGPELEYSMSFPSLAPL